MSANSVVNAICAALQVSEAAAQELAYANDSAGILHLKVHELKDIIRALKGTGYDRVKLSIAANKPGLIQMVTAAAKLELPTTIGTAPAPAPLPAAPVPAAPIVTHHVAVVTPQPGSHKPAAPLVAPKLASPPHNGYGHNAAHGYNAPHPNNAAAAASSSSASKLHIPAVLATSSAQAPQPAPAKKKKASKAHSFPTHPAYTYVVRAGDPPGIRDRMLAVLSTAIKMDAYRVLKAVPGVSAAEVLDELVTHDNAEQDLDPDILLLNIVARRETQQPQQHYHHGYNNGYNGEGSDYNDAHHDYTAEDAALQEQEDRDMDRAIAESEKERDVIQQRKRNRVEELRSGRDGYLASAEFQRSILLRGCGDCSATSNIGNSSPVKAPRPSMAVASPTSVSIGGSAHKPVTTSTTTVRTPAAVAAGASGIGNSVHNSGGTGSARPINILRRSVVDSLITAAAGQQKQQQRTTSVPQSASAQNNINNSTTSGNSASTSGTSCNMDIVDLTFDTSDSDCEVKPVNSSLRSPALSPERITSITRTHRSGTSATAATCPGPFSKTDIPSPSSVHSTHKDNHNSNANATSAVANSSVGCATSSSSATKKDAPAEIVDISRCKVLHKLAELLDGLTEYQDLLGCGSTVPRSDSAGNCGSSGSSSSSGAACSSSSSASSSLRQHIHDVTSLHSCSTQGLRMIAQLRAAVSRLLLLENNAVKFYPKTSSAYLLFLARRIDKKLLCYSLDEAVNCVVCKPSTATTGATTGTSTANNGADCILTLPAERIFIRYGAVTEFLDRTSANFERGMYKLPEDGHLVPALFRKPKLSCFAHALATRIDTDGIEVVDAGTTQDMLGYEEALLSSDEESVQAEPSPYNSDEDD